MVFHCLRYPSSKVYGTYIDNIGALVKQSGSQQITDSYPLFHTSIVAPTLSLALDLIQSNLQSN